jgi:hypothetical protein
MITRIAAAVGGILLVILANVSIQYETTQKEADCPSGNPDKDVPQGCSTLSSWTGESEMQHADANRRRVAA